MENFNLKYATEVFAQNAEEIEFERAVSMTRRLVAVLRDIGAQGLYPRAFRHLEEMTTTAGNVTKTSVYAMEKLVLMPEIANGDPASKYNLVIYLNDATCVVDVLFGGAEQEFCFFDEQYFAANQQAEFAELIADLQSRAYGAQLYCNGVEKPYHSDRFEPNLPEGQVLEHLEKRIQNTARHNPQGWGGFDRTKAYVRVWLWGEKEAHIYRY